MVVKSIIAADVLTQVRRFYETIEDHFGREGQIIGFVKELVGLTVKTDSPEVESALIAGRALGIVGAVAQLASSGGAEILEMAEDDLENILADAGAYRPAAEWMINRDVMSRAELKTLADALSRNTGLGAMEFEALLRQDVLALAESMSKTMTAAFQRGIARAAEQGLSVGQWADELRDTLREGLPSGIDAYLENVYRTEMSRAYQEQQRQFLDDPAITEVHWGDQLFANTDPERVHHAGHVEINGLLLRKGSEAYNASLDGPPWSYQCLCSRVPVVIGSPEEAADYEEPPDALELVRGIERF